MTDADFETAYTSEGRSSGTAWGEFWRIQYRRRQCRLAKHVRPFVHLRLYGILGDAMHVAVRTCCLVRAIGTEGALAKGPWGLDANPSERKVAGRRRFAACNFPIAPSGRYRDGGLSASGRSRSASSGDLGEYCRESSDRQRARRLGGIEFERLRLRDTGGGDGEPSPSSDPRADIQGVVASHVAIYRKVGAVFTRYIGYLRRSAI